MQSHPDRQDLSLEQGQWLVRLARQTLAEEFAKKIPQKDLDALDTALADDCYQLRCGTFVTLTLDKQLRGCIGSLTSDEPIRAGVRRNAINAAFHDPRFPPLSAADFEKVNIEVSILSEPQRLNYRDSDDLVEKLRPGVDGVILRKDHASATFLPQVWEQLPGVHEFLSHLCTKAGLAADAWRQTRLEISTYQVQHFNENR
ncbi:MAG: AmmeMemoRadiSam system protein A [Deltaproteobacteria bacterium]|jgi:AmmeMemoRadiSam system protein A|nr:AmmeMemoRadiSam system protein A [Deltaproteobacteria bacterium]MBW2488090.1 AmmeMemoRadiSam system protein A [Deltaproteobacteria bacterium]MBW2517739.1 AmmeMemoRadiSam system protein A [Deltaproteobacteria bacterium]